MIMSYPELVGFKKCTLSSTDTFLLRSTPVLDPRLRADHSPLSSGEMRGQFQAISGRFDKRSRLPV
jgi:hypothetical protein